ncbi:MAG: ABC transporter ATP-binding protein [Ruminococcus sp.]
MKTNKIEVKGLCKSFEGNSVLKDISFQIEAGEFVAVMGQSGCGKSTLLYSVSGMDRPTKGQIHFDSRELSALSDNEMQKLRLEHMGFIFQKPNFIKNLSIADNIVFPAFQLGKKSRKEIVADAEALMKKMGILSVADHDIRKVSGGQLQRAAICRAMINNPHILFGDEPTGALDTSSTKEVMDILEKINFGGTTILLVTHDAKVASRADRIFYLEDGKIKEELRHKKGTESNINEWLAKMGF